ncbi:MAG: hypothetical protein KBD37_08765 [Burkholderiales bacterium]|nr:hypothetical protein [Burkholderiales bacterium]
MKKIITCILFSISITALAKVDSLLVSPKNVLELPPNSVLMPNTIMNMFLNPLTNEPELPLFVVKGQVNSFTGQIATVVAGKMQLETVNLAYVPLTNNFLPNYCNYNINGSLLCFRSNSLNLDDNKILYQLSSSSHIGEQRNINVGVMGASVKFFAVTQFESNGEPIKYTAISNDNFNKTMILISCTNAQCIKTKLGVKPSVADSRFQIINNKLYFIAGTKSNEIVQIDLLTNEYTVLELNVSGISALSVDKLGNLYVLNQLTEPTVKPGSFAIAKCVAKSDKCQTIYTEKVYGAQYDATFIGVDDQWIYLVASNINPKTYASTNVLVRIVK